MPDDSIDDVYNDPDNVLANTDDLVEGGVELPSEQTDDMSQSIYNPEKTAPGDDRGVIPELETANGDEAINATSQTHPEDADIDSSHLANVNPADEQDGTER